MEEIDLRQAVRQNLRSVGIDSIRSTFGIPPHSHPLLQDAELHRKIQVSKHISAFLAATDHLPKLTLCVSLILHKHEQGCHTERSNSLHACMRLQTYSMSGCNICSLQGHCFAADIMTWPCMNCMYHRYGLHGKLALPDLMPGGISIS